MSYAVDHTNAAGLDGDLHILVFEERASLISGYFVAMGSFGVDLPPAFSTSLFVPAGFADHRIEDVQLHQPSATRRVFTAVRRSVAADASSTFDFSAFLPAVTQVSLSTATAARPAVSWTLAAAATVDGALVRVSWGADNRRWTLIGPAGAASLQAPPLPASLAASAPTGTILIDAVELVEAAALSGYDDFRDDFAAYVSGSDHDQGPSWTAARPLRRLTQSLR